MCYRTKPSTIWQMFSEFLVFGNLFHKSLGEFNVTDVVLHTSKRRLIDHVELTVNFFLSYLRILDKKKNV